MKAKNDLEIVFGHRASIALIQKHPEMITRIGCVRELENEVKKTLEKSLGKKRTEEKRVAIAVIREGEIERITQSNQHEGICVETKPRVWANLQEMGDALVAKRGIALALDRVRNSYNIGAVLRSAAFFGVDVAILGTPAPHPGLDPNAVRVAEGGVEHLTLARTTDLADTLARLKTRGVVVLGADGAATTKEMRAVFQAAADAPATKAIVLVLGNEREGIGPRVRAQCDELVAIRGTGNVESLNVAVASAVLISELARLLLHATKANVR